MRFHVFIKHITPFKIPQSIHNVSVTQIRQIANRKCFAYLKKHEGLIINQNISGDLVSHYLGCLNKSSCLMKDYSNFADLVFNSDRSIVQSLLIEYKINYVDNVLNKNNNRNTIEVFFKNDLNVSQTAKELYLNRNSLINKLDSISKELGFNVESFKFASVLLALMTLK